MRIAVASAAVLASSLRLRPRRSRRASPPAADPDVIFVPTPQEVVEEMLRIADVKKGDVLYDLGSGDGRIPVTAAKKFGMRAVGIDIDPQRIREANENARRNGVTDLVKFRQEDLFKADFREATVVTLYLLPDLNVKLRPRAVGRAQARHAHRLAPVRDGRLEAGEDGRAERPHDLLLDHPRAAAEKKKQ